MINWHHFAPFFPVITRDGSLEKWHYHQPATVAVSLAQWCHMDQCRHCWFPAPAGQCDQVWTATAGCAGGHFRPCFAATSSEQRSSKRVEENMDVPRIRVYPWGLLPSVSHWFFDILWHCKDCICFTSYKSNLHPIQSHPHPRPNMKFHPIHPRKNTFIHFQLQKKNVNY